MTRQQVNARVKVTARFEVDRHTGVTSDHHVGLVGQKGQAYPAGRRRVGDRAPEAGHHDVFWTKALHLGAATIAAIDQQRWQVERFFTAMTQHLKSKTFVGTSETAVMTHSWVALITSLILAFLRFTAGLGLSSQQMRRLLHMNRFARRKRVDLLNLQDGPAAGGRQLCRVYA